MPSALYSLTKVPVLMQNMDRHRGPSFPHATIDQLLTSDAEI